MAKHLLHLDGLLTERQLRAAAAAAAGAPTDGWRLDSLERATAPVAGATRQVSSGANWRPLAGLHDDSCSSSSGSRAALWLPLVDSTGEVLGAALCCPEPGKPAATACCSLDSQLGRVSTSSSGGHPCGGRFLRPIYVSVGHRVSLATALAVVVHCCRHRWVCPGRHLEALRLSGLCLCCETCARLGN